MFCWYFAFVTQQQLCQAITATSTTTATSIIITTYLSPLHSSQHRHCHQGGQHVGASWQDKNNFTITQFLFFNVLFCRSNNNNSSKKESLNSTSLTQSVFSVVVVVVWYNAACAMVGEKPSPAFMWVVWDQPTLPLLNACCVSQWS